VEQPAPTNRQVVRIKLQLALTRMRLGRESIRPPVGNVTYGGNLDTPKRLTSRPMTRTESALSWEPAVHLRTAAPTWAPPFRRSRSQTPDRSSLRLP